MSESHDPTRVLVVTAHPDDVDFGAAGSIATWTDQGIAVTYCIVTDGAAGERDPGRGGRRSQADPPGGTAQGRGRGRCH